MHEHLTAAVAREHIRDLQVVADRHRMLAAARRRDHDRRTSETR